MELKKEAYLVTRETLIKVLGALEANQFIEYEDDEDNNYEVQDALKDLKLEVEFQNS